MPHTQGILATQRHENRVHNTAHLFPPELGQVFVRELPLQPVHFLLVYPLHQAVVEIGAPRREELHLGANFN